MLPKRSKNSPKYTLTKSWPAPSICRITVSFQISDPASADCSCSLLVVASGFSVSWRVSTSLNAGGPSSLTKIAPQGQKRLTLCSKNTLFASTHDGDWLQNCIALAGKLMDSGIKCHVHFAFNCGPALNPPSPSAILPKMIP